jgi:hypothetical protein
MQNVRQRNYLEGKGGRELSSLCGRGLSRKISKI